MNRVELFLKYLRNNRMQEYEQILQKAKIKNYKLISLRDYVENTYDANQKLLVLRHDVDHFSAGTQMMFEVEKKHGVYSSFYFRNSTYEPTLMKEIESYGSEASLHFEVIADFIKANPNIKTKEELLESGFEEKCMGLLQSNLQRFRLLLDIPCVTIASHGEHENRMTQTPNNFLTEDSATYKDLGIKLEAYNEEFLKKVTTYISDAPIEVNGGYRYRITPLEAIEKNEQFVLFLSHPNHWYYSFFDTLKKLLKSIIKKPVNKKENFKRL